MLLLISNLDYEQSLIFLRDSRVEEHESVCENHLEEMRRVVAGKNEGLQTKLEHLNYKCIGSEFWLVLSRRFVNNLSTCASQCQHSRKHRITSITSFISPIYFSQNKALEVLFAGQYILAILWQKPHTFIYQVFSMSDRRIINFTQLYTIYQCQTELGRSHFVNSIHRHFWSKTSLKRLYMKVALKSNNYLNVSGQNYSEEKPGVEAISLNLTKNSCHLFKGQVTLANYSL